MTMDVYFADSQIQDYYWVLILVFICLIGLSGALFWYIRSCRRQPRYDYTALEDEALLNDRLEMGRKHDRDSERNMYMIQCQYYLRGSTRYIYLQQMSDIGSRQGKHWFLVRDTATKTERLLTMTLVAENCQVNFAFAVRSVLLELLLSLQHPYIYPVLDIDKKVILEREFIITVIPFNETGSLKDLIYRSQIQDDMKIKYRQPGCGLPQAQIQRLSCQILVALLFLKDQRFPPFVHLHSGNVILQNGVARLSGLENVLLGYASRHHSIIPKKLYDNKEVTEIICLGHLLFEMASGYELQASHPTEKNYCDIENYPQVTEVLRFIFEQGHNRYPTLRQLSSLEFFRHVDLRELPKHAPPTPVFRGNLSQGARNLLKEIKRHNRQKKRNRRSQSMSTLETASIDSKDSGSTKVSRKKKKGSISTSETTPDQLCTQLQTLPLPDIEGSVSIPSPHCSGDTPEVVIAAQRPSLHPMLLDEIRSGIRFKRARDWEPEV